MAGNNPALEQALHEFEMVAKQNGLIRDEVISMLREQIGTMQLNAKTDEPRRIETKLAVINTLSTLLKDQESACMTNAKLKLNQTEQDNIGNMGSVITDLLKQVRFSDGSGAIPKFSECDVATIDDNIGKRFLEGGGDIQAGELEPCSGHPKELVKKLKTPDKPGSNNQSAAESEEDE